MTKTRWTLTGPVRLEIDPQSGQTHIYYETAAPEGQPLDVRELIAAASFLDPVNESVRIVRDLALRLAESSEQSDASAE